MYERYQKLLDERGVRSSDVAKATGIPASTFSDWKKGRSRPKMAKLRKIADYFGVDVSYFGDDDVTVIEMPNLARGFDRFYDTYQRSVQRQIEEAVNEGRISTMSRIPVLGSIRAGYPVYAEENILDWIEVSMKASEDKDFYALSVKGDSMAPYIMEKDVLVVQTQDDADTGDTVIAMVNGDEATVKRLIKTSTGIILQPLNTEYDPMPFTWVEIEQLPVRIVGKVIEVRRKV